MFLFSSSELILSTFNTFLHSFPLPIQNVARKCCNCEFPLHVPLSLLVELTRVCLTTHKFTRCVNLFGNELVCIASVMDRRVQSMLSLAQDASWVE